MSSTPQPPLTLADRAFFQRIINLYHKRLLAAWKSVTGGAEAVPASHVAPPSIADWPNAKINQALTNFREHRDWFEVVELDDAIRVLMNSEWLLLHYAFRFLNSDPPVARNLRTLEISQCEPHLVRWERCCYYPALKPRWDEFRMERDAARNDDRPTGGGNETNG
ncbi:hypothetical protein EDC01DRAFT_641367 [Geopyxis carbonaria]|nr:hypothetical protein EDC01DRAFT_672912 [Geopyxis carbonaria]KAI5804921.1 hypothetical protein EDC01DRAFT_641367 [Geopyxis carbonaria]